MQNLLLHVVLASLLVLNLLLVLVLLKILNLVVSSSRSSIYYISLEYCRLILAAATWKPTTIPGTGVVNVKESARY